MSIHSYDISVNSEIFSIVPSGDSSRQELFCPNMIELSLFSNTASGISFRPISLAIQVKGTNIIGMLFSFPSLIIYPVIAVFAGAITLSLVGVARHP
jgi:hypothetical protein